MTSKTPRESRSFADYDADGALRWDGHDRHGIHTVRPDCSEVGTDDHGHYGSLRQNLTNHWQVQDR